ncbi:MULTISPECIES: hypothetical protein [unclassified Chelatococcus]|uniref:hypothetical protein n=1 Tax=unclassified Chelatococcus TaxID=2638111 RepID=UPI001BD11D91|nr:MULTISPECIES: hypothetical protein [unclassified Chelatococcus]MBS7698261.1 hypothetical protein [Chelatococcus sp. YT9]MBX3560044.1 hypothetical protein [Chelatococcus sp.]
MISRQNSIILAVGLLLAAVTYQSLKVLPERIEMPLGCDPFGYLRQAELFRKQGLGGFSTELSGPMPELLIDFVGKAKESMARYGEVIAPHCHHLDLTTGKIIIQYPPGTGLLLAAFSSGIQSRALDMVLVALVAALAFACAVLTRSSINAVGMGLLGAATILLFDRLYVTWSVGPTILMAIIAAALQVQAFSSQAYSRRLWLALAAGVAVGFASNMRVTNVLIGVGPLAVYGLLFLKQRSRQTFYEGLVAGLGILLGAVPVLISNTINAGAPWKTTYGSNDASPPKFEADMMLSNAHYYLTLGWPSAFTVAAAIGLVAVWLLRPKLPLRLPNAMPLAITIGFGVNVIFFLTHHLRTEYYMVGASVWTCYAAAFTLASHQRFVRWRDEPARYGLAAAAGIALLIAALVAPIKEVNPLRHQETTLALPPNSMVWGDLSTGLFVMHLRQYAAKLVFTGPDEQSELLDALRNKGVTQFFVNDSLHMAEVIARLKQLLPLHDAGKAFGYEVFSLQAAPSAPSPASRL